MFTPKNLGKSALLCVPIVSVCDHEAENDVEKILGMESWLHIDFLERIEPGVV